MPMLGKKQFNLVKSPSNVAAGEVVYTVPHTKETFRSKEEYDKRLELYKQSIWTCRCTGHTTLTHEEAWKSEQAAFKILRTQFLQCFEKPVLQFVHHSTESLDVLNDQAWTKVHQVLVPGESVNFKFNNGSKVLKGTVLSITPNAELCSLSASLICPGGASTASSKCNSPSSDKENKADSKSPRKWTPPKLLPNKYSVKLEDGLVVNSVPVDDLMRTERPPSKDLVRLFIRAHAVRCGTSSNSPWVVDDALVKKYSLPSKFADFLLSPAKMAEAAKRAEEAVKKRKRSSQDGGAVKKQKLCNGSEKKEKKDKDKLKPVSLNKKVKTAGKAIKDSNNKAKKEKKDGSAKKKVSPEKVKKKQLVIQIDDSSDEEVSLATIKRSKPEKTDDSDSDVPLSNLTDQATPKKKKFSLTSSGLSPNKKKKASDSGKKSDKKQSGTPKKKKTEDTKSPKKRKRHDSGDSDVPLNKLTPKKAPGSSKKSPGKSLQEKNESTPQKKQAKSSDASATKSEEKRGRGRPKLGEEKTAAKPKSMKQTTLLDMATKKGNKASSSGTTPKKSPAKPQTPLIVKKLIALNKDPDRQKFSMLLKKAVIVLTPTQKKNLPSPIKEKVQRRMELIEEKKSLEKMSEAERQQYFKEKKEKQKKKIREKVNEKMKEMRQRYEDQDLKLQPLPAPKLVPTPDNLPNELFGDIAMVTEFISSYSGLLMPDSEYPIYTDALMKALAGGAQGFAYLSRVLGVLLQTLLQDEIAEGYSELRVPLSDIAVNPFTASELVRLCLRKDDSGKGAEAEDEDEEVPDALIQQLESQEFFQLDVGHKLTILRGLCLRVMATYSIQDYMEEKQREAIQLTKQRITEMKDYNEKNKDKKPKVEEKPGTPTVNGDVNSTAPAVTLTNFYGKKPEDSPATNSPADSQGEGDGENLVSVLKSRRMMAARAAQEKEKRDLERRLIKEKEFEEERKRRAREQFETKFKDSIHLAKTVLRHVPIGYDRHHNRYWMFTNTTPGLYIEKGWMSQEIDYNPGNVPDERENDSSQAASTPASSPAKSPGKQKLNLNKKKAMLETTVPSCGQNLWFTYTSLKDLDALLHNLHPQGIREAALKTEIKKRYQDITKAIQGYQRNNLELRDSEGNEEIFAGLKKELSDIELRLRNGGLGGVANYSDWEAKLMSATDIQTMGECLLESQENIMDKFLMKFMKLPKKEELEEVKKEEDEEEEEDQEEEEEDKEEKKLTAAERRLQEWKDAVTNCPTVSRLHVLLSMMDSCIKWEKSAENAKCKICRKKGNDDRMLLCDDCNQAFHMYCLRPQLIYVPKSDWFCAACVPHTKRRSLKPRYGDEESESEGEKEVQETNCTECGGEAGEEDGEELVPCHKCSHVYHLDCHQPPLRRAPRGFWECNDCKTGVTRRKKNRPQRRAAASKKSYKAPDSMEEEEEESSEEEEEEEEEENEEEESTPPPSRRASRAASNRSTSNSRRSGRTSAETTSSRNRSSSRSTRRSADVCEEVTPPQRSRRAPSDLSLCEDILQRLMKFPNSWPFLEPVNKKAVPDYHQIIKKPMDFLTMQKKCTRLSYSSPQEFVDDAILVFSNAAKYNPASSDVYSCMKEAEKFFSQLLAKYLPEYASTQQFVSNREDVSARSRRSRRN